MPIHGYPGNVITANPTAPTSSVASGVWTTEQQLLAVSQGNWPGYEYPISRSLRFNSADSAYLNRTPASASNRKTWTWSGWVKRSTLGTDQILFGAYDNSSASDSTYTGIFLASTNALVLSGWSQNWRVTTQVFRDPSAWYHIVVVLDTTQATANNRVKIYVNGAEITAFGTTNNPTQNADLGINATNQHGLGRINYLTGSGPYYYNGYMTEVNFVDGQALTPSSFGLNDPETGVWSPKQYTGTYGTNGFYLNFSDNSGTTSTTLGKDYSGNGNNWTPNNFSVTAGAGNDSLVDTPTSYGTDTGVGGEVRGNYATFNPLVYRYSVGHATETNGNLESAGSSGVAATYSFGTIDFSDGKFVAEATLLTSSTAYGFGVCNVANITNDVFTQNVEYLQNGSKTVNGSNTSYGASYTTNDVIRCEVDVSGQTVQFFKNGTSQGTITSVTFTTPITFYVRNFNGSKWAVNFGQRPFANTATSGFKALCTQNLPTPTIGATSTTQAGKYFNPVLYTGNGSTQSITGVGFQPDLIWIKDRSNARAHVLQNVLAGFSQYLQSNATDAETTASSGVTAVGADGFTVGTQLAWNSNTETYVAWNWKANGAGSSNTAGTITSTVSANTTSGFSIVTYTGNGTSGATVGHGLGVAPSMVIIKARTQPSAHNWVVGHSSLNYSTGQYIVLNLTNAVASASTIFNNTAPSSSVVTLGNFGWTNGSTYTYVMYAFAPVAGYSAFGSYTGNGSTDGPFVYTGFRPRYVLLKVSSTTSNWTILDSVRGAYNVNQLALFSDLSGAEENTVSYSVDFLSNGFKLRTSGGAININAATIIYAAFAESPFKYSLAR